MATGFGKELLRRRVPQIFGVYLAIGWGVLEFSDWLVNRYVLSPHLVDFALVAWATMIPTVLLVAWNHGAPGRDRWTRAEKIGVPLNLAVAAVIMIAAFGGRSLGAATTAVTVEDEVGATVERIVPKSEFRKRLAFFYFDNASGDTALDWLQYGLPLAVQDDLLQDLFMDVRGSWPFFGERLTEAGYPDGLGVPLALQRDIAEHFNLPYFVSGTVGGTRERLEIALFLHDTKRGRRIETREFSGGDIFELADQISVQLKRDLKVPEHHIEETRDLPAAEMLTASVPAYRHFVDGWRAFESEDWAGAADAFGAAVQEDPVFAYAHLMLFNAELLLNRLERAAPAVEAAMQHGYKLPERYQFAMKAVYYRVIKGDAGKALAVSQMHAELFPEDVTAHSLLYGAYVQAGERDKAIAAAERILELDPGEISMLRNIGSLHDAMGNFEEAARYYERYTEEAPTEPNGLADLADLQRRLGRHDRARELYERALVLDPGNTDVLIGLARTEDAVGNLEFAAGHLEEAVEAAGTPLQRWQAYAALSSLSARRGQLVRAIDYTERSWTELEASQPPLVVVQQKLGDLGIYVEAGQVDAALEALGEIGSQLSPPLDLLLAFGELDIADELEDPDGIEQALEKMDRLISVLGLEVLRTAALMGRGRMLELRGECDQAVIAFRQAIELTPSAVSINNAIGRCQRKLGRFDAARQSLERVLEVDPFAPRTNLEMARVLAGSRDTAKAREHLQRALDVWRDADPGYEPAREARELAAELGGSV